MPIYEYRCHACDKRFEAFLTSSSEQAVCPQCHGTKLQKLMSTFAASVAGGYKATQATVSSQSEPPKSGGCGGGCSCH